MLPITKAKTKQKNNNKTTTTKKPDETGVSRMFEKLAVSGVNQEGSSRKKSIKKKS